MVIVAKALLSAEPVSNVEWIEAARLALRQRDDARLIVAQIRELINDGANCWTTAFDDGRAYVRVDDIRTVLNGAP